MSTTMSQSEFNALPLAVQETIKSNPAITIVADNDVPFETTETLGTTAPMDLTVTDEEEEEPMESESDLWLNIYINHGGKRMRLTAQSLDSDFIKFMDREKTKVNGLRDSLVNTVEKHGTAKANDAINFEVEITKRGESAITGDVDLIG